MSKASRRALQPLTEGKPAKGKAKITPTQLARVKAQLRDWNTQELLLLEDLYMKQGHSYQHCAKELAKAGYKRTPQQIMDKLTNNGWRKFREYLAADGSQLNELSDRVMDSVVAHKRVERGMNYLVSVGEDMQQVLDNVKKTALEASLMGIGGLDATDKAVKIVEKIALLQRKILGLDKVINTPKGSNSLGYEGNPEDIVGEAPPSNAELPGIKQAEPVEEPDDDIFDV